MRRTYEPSNEGKVAAPAAADKAPIAATEALADSKTSTEAPAAEPLHSQGVEAMEEIKEEAKEEVTCRWIVGNVGNMGYPIVIP